MKTRLLLFLVLGSLMAKAQTIEVSGTQSGVWDAETVLVKGDVKVQDSITFTVTDTTGFHIFNAGRGGWNGIRLSKAGRSEFDYCRFQYGKAALDHDQDGGALRIFNCEIGYGLWHVRRWPSLPEMRC